LKILLFVGFVCYAAIEHKMKKAWGYFVVWLILLIVEGVIIFAAMESSKNPHGRGQAAHGAHGRNVELASPAVSNRSPKDDHIRVQASLALSGDMLADIYIAPRETVQILRTKIAVSSGLDPGILRLTFNGLSLSTYSRTLANVGLHNGSTVEVCKVCRCDSDDPAQAEQAWKNERSIEDESHFSAWLVQCHSCDRRALRVFTELIDWQDGDDSMASMIVPLSDDEFQAARSFQSEDDIIQLFERKSPCKFLLRIFPKGFKGQPAWEWSEGKAHILPHD